VPEAIEIQLKKGALELCVLALLSQARQLRLRDRQPLADAIGMGEGTIYPLMRRLQADGLVETYLVESKEGPPRKYYRLSEAGKKSFESQQASWKSFSGAVEPSLEGPNDSPGFSGPASGRPARPSDPDRGRPHGRLRSPFRRRRRRWPQ
jgi:PadR family transcriptional regulator PadR